jgi:hypothetical protein
MIEIEIAGQDQLNNRLQALSEAKFFDHFLADVAQNAFDQVEAGVGKHSKTGMLEKALGSGAEKIGDREYQVRVDGQVAPYGVFVHWGHRAFRMYPDKRKALRWVSGNSFVFAKWVDIPAYAGDPFMVDAVTNVMRDFDSLVSKHLKLEEN